MRPSQILILTIALLALLLAPAFAQADWQIVLGAFASGTPHLASIVLGTSASATDGYDGSSLDVLGPAGLHETMGIYHFPAEGWLGPEGFYDQDIRAPVLGQKTWDNIYLWWTPEASLNNVWIRLDYTQGAFNSYRYTLYLDQVPDGVVYEGPRQWEFTPDDPRLTTSVFTPSASETGLDGYKFHLTVEVIPEPSSLAAISLALLPIVQTLVRRRRT